MRRVFVLITPQPQRRGRQGYRKEIRGDGGRRGASNAEIHKHVSPQCRISCLSCLPSYAPTFLTQSSPPPHFRTGNIDFYNNRFAHFSAFYLNLKRGRKCCPGHARTAGDTPKRAFHARVPREDVAVGFRALTASVGTASRRACTIATVGNANRRRHHWQYLNMNRSWQGSQNYHHYHRSTYRHGPSHKRGQGPNHPFQRRRHQTRP